MLYAIVGVLVIIIDQLVKYTVAGTIAEGAAGQVIFPGLLSLVNLHNDGAAFGFLSGGGARIPFIVLALVFLIAVIVALATGFISNRVGRWSLALMAAGGLSNCIDRVAFGFVQDMFKLDQFTLFGHVVDFPVFNVADIFITVFCLLFVIAIIFGRSDVEYDDDEFDEEDDEEEDRPVREKKEKAPKPPKNTRKARQAKYEDEYEQYKAAKAARQQEEAAAQAQPPVQPRRAPVSDADNPFAEWERANAAANAAKQPVAPQQPARPVAPQPPVVPQQPVRPAAPQQPAAPKKSSDEFSLEDILAEFK